MTGRSINPQTIEGHLFALAAPSGAGKSTIIDYVLSEIPELYYPVSATTRNMRPGERPGREYYFLTPEEFDDKIAEGEFLEWAWVHGTTRYGTLMSEVVRPLQSGKSVLRHIDYQGIRNICGRLPKDHVHVIYIDAGDWDNLLARIQSRTPLSPEEIERRYQSFLQEQKFIPEADFVVSNRDGELEQAKESTVSIIRKYI